MNRILLAGSTSMELVRLIAGCLAGNSDRTVIIVGKDNNDHDFAQAPRLLNLVKIPIKAYEEFPTLNVKEFKRDTGTAKENYSHRSKFHSKHL